MTSSVALEQKALDYREERIAYWNAYERRKASRYYHEQIARIYCSLVPPGRRVLELGCGEGELLAALEPSRGTGIDFPPTMIGLFPVSTSWTVSSD